MKYIIRVKDFDTSVKLEDETIYAVGRTTPIGEKTNGETYSGKISMQNGELSVLLQTQRLSKATDIQNAVLAIASLNGIFNRVYSGVNIISEDLSVAAKSKESLVSLNWKAIEQK